MLSTYMYPMHTAHLLQRSTLMHLHCTCSPACTLELQLMIHIYYICGSPGLKSNIIPDYRKLRLALLSMHQAIVCVVLDC